MPSAARRLLPLLVAIGLILAVGAVVGARAMERLRPAPLPELGALPSFTLTDQEGTPFGPERLRGQVWVANFIFTRCPTICPTFTAKMASLERETKELGPRLHWVSFSVDPKFDTPDRLKAYAHRFDADLSRWTFVTGDPAVVQRTVADGFKIATGRSGPEDDVGSLFHGTYFVLVDGRGHLRGYYDSSDAEGVDRLRRDLRALLAAERS